VANLNEIGNLIWLQMFPNGTDEAPISREEIITSCRTQYALAMWTMARNTKNQDGEFEVPSNILAQSEPLPVVDNEIDISELKILRGLPSEQWLQKVGSLTCECDYVKSTVNKANIFCDVEDGLADTTKTYYVIGKKIFFPKGTHADKLPIIYAVDGEDIDGMYEVDDVVAAIIQQQVLGMYMNKTGQEDTNNDGKPN